MLRELRLVKYLFPLPAGERVRVRGLFTAAASAMLLALAFSSFNLSFLVWIGLVPLFFALEGKSPKEAFFISYLCGFLFFFSSMYWLVFVTPLGWIVLSLYQALYFGLFGLLYRYIPTTYDLRPRTYIFVPSAWCILEYLRSHIVGGIGWNLLGYAEYQNLPVIQIADITGIYGVSFLVVLLNLSVFRTIKMGTRCQKTHKRLFAKSNLSFKEEIKASPFLQILAISIVVITVLVYGYKKIDLYEKKDISSDKLKISVVQGNIGQMYKWDPAYRDYIMEQYRQLTLKAAKEDPDLIIWPETSIPGYLNAEAQLRDYLQDVIRASKKRLLVGAPTVEVLDDQNIIEYNSALMLLEEGMLSKQYNKLRLVPFGEYIPLERYLPFLRRFFPITGSFSPGSEYTLFELQAKSYKPQANFGVLICFEDVFPGMVRRFVRDGANFMVNVTNDAWFHKTAAAYQHAANSVFRAVENRRPFVRSANTGLSCFIDRAGRIYEKVSSTEGDLFIDGYKATDINILPDAGFSFYTRFGDIFIIGCFVIAGLFIFDYRRLRRYNK